MTHERLATILIWLGVALIWGWYTFNCLIAGDALWLIAGWLLPFIPPVVALISGMWLPLVLIAIGATMMWVNERKQKENGYEG